MNYTICSTVDGKTLARVRADYLMVEGEVATLTSRIEGVKAVCSLKNVFIVTVG